MAFWSPADTRVLFQAVAQAPSVHNTQPWVMELHERNVLLYERWDVKLPHHDPTGRDRLLSCGAALTNLELAMRHLGWETDTVLFPDPAHPDQAATVEAVRRRQPTENEQELYDAIALRQSQRFGFDGEPLTTEEIHTVEHALLAHRVGVRRVADRTEASVIAGLTEHTAKVLRHDGGYLRELRSLIIDRGHGRAGIPADRIGHGLFGGLIHSGDRVPDHDVLTSRIAKECVLIVETVDDTKWDHVRAGAAIQRGWLAATALGLAASLITQPLQLPEVRAGLSEQLCLPGFPHGLLRVGRSQRAVNPVHAARTPTWSDKARRN
ncbi:MAG: nitroreductase family protein [Kibdelosporangium sp.]